MNTKAQITLEAAVLIIIIAAAFLAMQGYFRRAVQGHWKSSADSFSDEQYDNGAVESATALSFMNSKLESDFNKGASQFKGEWNVNVRPEESVVIRPADWGCTNREACFD